MKTRYSLFDIEHLGDHCFGSFPIVFNIHQEIFEWFSLGNACFSLTGWKIRTEVHGNHLHDHREPKCGRRIAHAQGITCVVATNWVGLPVGIFGVQITSRDCECDGISHSYEQFRSWRESVEVSRYCPYTQCYISLLFSRTTEKITKKDYRSRIPFPGSILAGLQRGSWNLKSCVLVLIDCVYHQFKTSKNVKM